MPDTKTGAPWRYMQLRSGDFAAREEDGERIIEGYFAVFDGEYVMGDWGVERIDPHAFDDTLGGDVRALVNHDTTLVLGRTTVRTLELSVDSHGLFGRIHVNGADQDAVNAHARVGRGDVSQCSFGFDILDEKTERLEDGRTRWTILRLKLYEVSICTFPAYEDTAVVARRKDLDALRARELECWRERMRGTLKKEA